MKFPKMDDKSFDKLPVVFREIIKYDELDPRQEKIVKLVEYNEYMTNVQDWKYNRNNLSEGARRFVAKQRGGSVA